MKPWQAFSRWLERRGWKPAGTSRNPDFEALGMTRSVAGPDVSVESALRFPPVFRAVDLLASYCAKLPCHVYRTVGEGKERDPKHPAYWIVRRKSSRYIPAYFMRYAMTAQALLRGNSYAFILRDSSRKPLELIPLDPDGTYPDRDTDVLFYRTVTASGQMLEIDYSDILHLRTLSDGILGTSVISKACDAIGTGLAQQEYEGRFYSNSARPSVVIEHPRSIGPEAVKTLRRSWTEIYGGLANAHKPGILEEGATLKVFGMSHRDAQLVEARKLRVIDIANIFGVPPHKLGDDTRTAYASLEEENQSFLDDGLEKWLSAWETEYWDKLLSEREKREELATVEFLRQALARADLEKRGAFYALMINTGVFSRDEVRARENMNPIPDGKGKEYLEPLNMAPAGSRGAGESSPPPTEDEEARRADRRRLELEVLSATLSRMARRLATTAEKASRKPESWMTFVEGLGPDHVFFSALKPICDLCGTDSAAIGDEFWRSAKAELDQCGDVTPERLAGEVEKAARRIESELPARILAKIGESDGN